jgi:hypothetical protein
MDGARMTVSGFDVNGDLVVDGPNDPAAVSAIQVALRDLGYPVTVSGAYGNETAEQVRQFKIDKHLTVPAGMLTHDGVTGPGTTARLNDLFTVPELNIPIDPPPFAPAEVPLETTVRGHIKRALDTYQHLPEYDRLWLAAWSLKSERNSKVDGLPINCDNKPLAYAEHYMLARAFVASGSFWPDAEFPVSRFVLYRVAIAAVQDYDVGKLPNAIIAALPNLLGGATDKARRSLLGLVYQLGECPISDAPPDATSIAWGWTGAYEGRTPL